MRRDHIIRRFRGLSYGPRRGLRHLPKLRSRGFTLVEVAVASAGFALVALLATSLLAMLQTRGVQSRSLQSMDKIEDAVAGFALINSRLPAPLNPSGSTGGYVDGLLPSSELGVVGATPVLMRVRDVLIAAPQPAFNPDPVGTTGGKLGLASTANGLDLCATLVESARTGSLAAAAGANDVPVVYGLVGLASVPNSAVTSLDASMKPPAGSVSTETRLRGDADLIGRLGCLPALYAVMDSAREVGVLTDAVRVAELTHSVRTVYADSASWGVGNQIWRGMNRVIQLAQGTASFTLTMSTIGQSNAAKAGAALTIAGIVASMTGSANVVARSAIALPKASAAAAKAADDVVAHEQYVEALKTKLTVAVNAANAQQAKGLRP